MNGTEENHVDDTYIIQQQSDHLFTNNSLHYFVGNMAYWMVNSTCEFIAFIVNRSKQDNDQSSGMIAVSNDFFMII